MRLVYKNNPAREVKVGDKVTVPDLRGFTVDYFRPPHKPESEGKVTIRRGRDDTREYYVSVIGAVWVEREDRPPEPLPVGEPVVFADTFCECRFEFGKGEYTQAEREGLVWLATRTEPWVQVNVSRNSPREFDLRIDGVRSYVSDEREPSVQVGPNTWQAGKLTGRKVRETMRFSGWFPLACLREFWGMGLIEAAHGDWSFIRDREKEVQWADFADIVAGSKPRGKPAKVGGVIRLSPDRAEAEFLSRPENSMSF